MTMLPKDPLFEGAAVEIVVVDCAGRLPRKLTSSSSGKVMRPRRPLRHRTLLALSGLDPVIAKTPWGVVLYLFLQDGAGDARSTLFRALAVTLPHTVAGVAAGILFAYDLAVLGVLAPWLVRGWR